MKYYGESICKKCGKVLKTEINGKDADFSYNLYEDKNIKIGINGDSYEVTCRCSKCATENIILAK